jgi:hypothetical protein
VAFAEAHPDRVWEKWTRHARSLLGYYPTLGGFRLVPVIALFGLAFSAGRRLRPIAWLLFASFVANAAFVCLTDHFLHRYHYQFVPVMLLLGVGVTWRLLGRLPRPGVRVVVLCLLVAAALPSPESVRRTVRGVQAGAARVAREDMAFVKAHTDEDAVVFSDQSWAVTWATGRRTVRAHFDRTPDGAPTLSVLRFHEEFLPIDAVYLRFNHRRTRQAHRALRDDPGFRALFPKRHRFSNGAVLYYR